jgi:hypothetical protein
LHRIPGTLHLQVPWIVHHACGKESQIARIVFMMIGFISSTFACLGARDEMWSFSQKCMHQITNQWPIAQAQKVALLWHTSQNLSMTATLFV